MTGKIVILGGGESGTGAAILALKKGFDVFLSDFGGLKPAYRKLLDEYGIKYEENQHTEELILDADEVIKSPGIPDHAPIIKKIQASGIPVISEIEFAGRYTDAKLICVTGSNGKTTTTLWIYDLLKRAGLKTGLGGNVGQSFALQVANQKFDYYVLEISSFQLDGMFEFKADIAILMNITPDHLDRYENNFQYYVNSKFRICNNQNESDVFIYCKDDSIILEELERRDIRAEKLSFSLADDKSSTAYTDNNMIKIDMDNSEFQLSFEEMTLSGRHNVYNSMAAGITGKVLNIRKELIRESLAGFTGVEHRLEKFIKVHGIEFINDSKATNVNSTWYALESMKTRLVWIVGGVDKGNDYSCLRELVREKVKAIVCLGKDVTKIHAAFEDMDIQMFDAPSMHEAVKASYYLAEKDETVLLSPACASFDLFDNYEDRGRKFKEAVREL